MGEIERESQTNQAGCKQNAPTAEESEDAKQGVSGDADGRDRHVSDLGETAVVDDAAIPLFIDAAGLQVCGEMDMQGEAGDDNATNGEKEDDESHG